MARLLSPPARFSNGLVVAFSLGTVAGVGYLVAGTLVTALLMATLVTVAVGLAALGRQGAVFRCLGTATVALGSLGLVATVALGVLLGVAWHDGVASLVLPVTLVSLTLGGTVVVSHRALVVGRPEVRTAMVSLLYAVAPVAVFGAGLAVFRLDLVALDLPDPVVVARTTAAALVELALFNDVTRAGTLILAVGVAREAGGGVAGVPIVGGFVKRVRTARGDDEDEADSAEGAPSSRWAAETRPSLLGYLVPNTVWGLFVAFLGLYILGVGRNTLQPGWTFAAIQANPTLVRTLDLVVGSVVRSNGVLGVAVGLALAAIGRGVGRALATQARYVAWLEHQRRLLRVGTAVCVTVGVVAAAPEIVTRLTAIQRLHYVPIPTDGVVVFVQGEGIYVTEFRPLELDLVLVESTENFRETTTSLRDHVGAAVIVTVPVAVGLTATLLATFFGSKIVWPYLSRRLGVFEAGLALMFVGVVVGATLGASPLAIVVIAGLVYHIWDLSVTADGLAVQLDEDAVTLRGELIHVGANTAVLVGGAGLAVAGSRAVEYVPTDLADWQLFLALALALAATVINVAGLWIRRE